MFQVGMRCGVVWCAQTRPIMRQHTLLCHTTSVCYDQRNQLYPVWAIRRHPMPHTAHANVHTWCPATAAVLQMLMSYLHLFVTLVRAQSGSQKSNIEAINIFCSLATYYGTDQNEVQIGPICLQIVQLFVKLTCYNGLYLN